MCGSSASFGMRRAGPAGTLITRTPGNHVATTGASGHSRREKTSTSQPPAASRRATFARQTCWPPQPRRPRGARGGACWWSRAIRGAACIDFRVLSALRPLGGAIGVPNSADEQAPLPFVRIAGERAQACRDGAGKGFVVPGVKAAHRDHDPVEAYPSPEQGVAVPQQVRSTYLDDVAVDAELP